MKAKHFKELISCIASLHRLSLSTLLKKNRFEYNKVKQGSVFVLGTGPSLDSCLQILEKNCVQAEYFAVNDFALTTWFEILHPSYYILIDPAYWLPIGETSSSDLRTRERLFDKMNSVTTWPLTLFIPSHLRGNELIRECVNNTNISIRYFNYTNIESCDTKFYTFLLKHNFGVVPVGNVLGAAIYLSINLGYDDIYLLGAEHSWTKDICVNDDNQVCIVKRHSGGVNENDDVLVPWYDTNMQIFSMSLILGTLRRHFRGYEVLQKYAHHQGVRVYNATPNSFIDAFLRKKLI